MRNLNVPVIVTLKDFVDSKCSENYFWKDNLKKLVLIKAWNFLEYYKNVLYNICNARFNFELISRRYSPMAQ